MQNGTERDQARALFALGNLLKLARLGAIAAAGGALFAWLHVPLPWMIGALVFTSAAKLLGLSGRAPIQVRMTGQVIVGTAIGLYFTPAALDQALTHLPAMVAVAFATIGLGLASAALMCRLSGVDAATAFFACIPGGPAEMANLAERAGLQPAPVALAQTLRIAALVLVIPPAVTWSGIAGAADLARFAGTVRWPELLLLLVLAIAAARGFRAIGVPNAWFLGPVAASAVLAASGSATTGIPFVLVALGQLCLGVTLGSTFDRAFVGRIRPYLRGVVACTVFLMASCAGLALGIGAWTGLPIAAMILATAPGSLTEMCLTAKALDLSVAMVTAFHLVRLFIVVPLTPVLFALARRWLPGIVGPVPDPAAQEPRLS